MILPDELLQELGIIDWGYTEESIPRTFSEFSSWVAESHHGSLNYLSDHRKELRSDLKKLFPEFESALVFLFSYQPTKKWLLENNQHQIASYALGFEGEDYHHALKRKLQKIEEQLRLQHPQLKSFMTLDAQPVLERDLAFRAGLGWFGKNSMLISRAHGSYFIIGSLLLNQKLTLKSKEADIDHCGTCRACADACPTQAIDVETRTLKASLCISTFTIEMMKEAEPPLGYEKSRGEIFGCDICQDVCPWNRKPLDRTHAAFSLHEQFEFLKAFLALPASELKQKIESMSGKGFQRVMQGTALGRPGKRGWLKNFR